MLTFNDFMRLGSVGEQVCVPRRARMAKAQSICVGMFASIATLATSGCGESHVPVFPVSGRITYLGRPPVGAQVVLHPVNSSQTSGVVPVGVVNKDGSFTVTAYEPGDGAPPGDYVATVQWFKIVNDTGGAGPGPNVLPAKYARPDTSPIRVSVKEESTDIPPIEIARQ
jgi:hypothetical protein